MREMGTVRCHRLVEFVAENENVRTKESCPERLTAAVPPDACATSPRVLVQSARVRPWLLSRSVAHGTGGTPDASPRRRHHLS